MSKMPGSKGFSCKAVAIGVVLSAEHSGSVLRASAVDHGFGTSPSCNHRL